MVTDKQLVDRLEIIAKDREFVDSVLKGKLTPAEQKKRVRALLMPDELERYDAGMALIKSLGNQKVPKYMIRDEIDLTVVKNLPRKSAEPLRRWMQANSKGIRLYGSVVDWLYSKSVPDASKPSDVDIATNRPSSDVARELAGLIKETSGERTRVYERKLVEGNIVQVYKNGVWIDAVDVHHMTTYKTKMPYGWKTKEAIIIDGVPTERLCEQLHRRGVTTLNVGVGLEGRGKIGAEAAQTPTRIKDMKKIRVVARILIKAAREEGKDDVAKEASGHLREFAGEVAKGYPKIKTLTDTIETQKPKVKVDYYQFGRNHKHRKHRNPARKALGIAEPFDPTARYYLGHKLPSPELRGRI